ncbi:class I histocompatibility antigen, F10 alpha chain-like [Chiloscyllium plagiosum]|uniref:class I histocompatibility antigen, F10 alpha chain-like n=1 Tax=Chiloscyllium plagiosum TaxID=36176 RepID=UPI001CB86C09|nr:class I histocompatibility antigen, F10 alpha chain-like [Chiloscyllium plagiosum]
MVNGIQTGYFDSDTRRCVPRQQFLADSLSVKFWDDATDQAITHTRLAKGNLKSIMKRTNQTSGKISPSIVHIIPQVTPLGPSPSIDPWVCPLSPSLSTDPWVCPLSPSPSTDPWVTIGTLSPLIRPVEVSDDGSIKRSMRFGFDGKDHISLEPDRMRWVAANHFAVINKEKWNSDQSWNYYWESYLQKTSVEHLNRYLEVGKDYFTRKVQPEVFISRREPSCQDKPLTLSCLVTGFYPVDIEVTWLRNGEVMSETHSSGVQPNHDGTHQIQKEIEINAGDEDQYSRHIEHSSLAEAQLY